MRGADDPVMGPALTVRRVIDTLIGPVHRPQARGRGRPAQDRAHLQQLLRGHRRDPFGFLTGTASYHHRRSFHGQDLGAHGSGAGVSGAPKRRNGGEVSGRCTRR
ncbi:hypothetical protein GCM10010341_37710 [Streptomyces noursei]|nr:hypothetical protein GCM10010341_37710 [Streptomyces noursei]